MTLSLPAESRKLTTLTSAESRVLDLLNSERRKALLAPLAIDYVLVRAAREHSREMCRQNYFSHRSATPGKGTPVMRWIAELGYVPYGWALIGENLGWCRKQDIGLVHSELMKSATHRSNVLEPRYERVGIGIHTNRKGEFWVTQMFLSVRESSNIDKNPTIWSGGWWAEGKSNPSMVIASAR